MSFFKNWKVVSTKLSFLILGFQSSANLMPNSTLKTTNLMPTTTLGEISTLYVSLSLFVVMIMPTKKKHLYIRQPVQITLYYGLVKVRIRMETRVT